VVAFEEGVPGHQVMGEAARLSPLKMGVGGHQNIDLTLSPIKKGRAEVLNCFAYLRDSLSTVEPQIRRDLIVARTPRVKLAADGPDNLGHSGLDIHMNLLARWVPFEVARFNFLGDLIEPFHEEVSIVLADDAYSGETTGVRL
jgi:hypothetical protein